MFVFQASRPLAPWGSCLRVRLRVEGPELRGMLFHLRPGQGQMPGDPQVPAPAGRRLSGEGREGGGHVCAGGNSMSPRFIEARVVGDWFGVGTLVSFVEMCLRDVVWSWCPVQFVC